jgi:hypothetical protein
VQLPAFLEFYRRHAGTASLTFAGAQDSGCA